MSRAEARLLELRQAAQVALTEEDVSLIMAEELALHEALEATRIDEVAHFWIRLASNPDHVRSFLRDCEAKKEGFVKELAALASNKKATES